MIPHYQQASLEGENVAKRRVMKKAKISFEGEEQRAIKSGQVIDELKTAYKTIVQNLQLQLLTMSLTKSTILSIVSAASTGGLAYYPGDEDRSARMSDEGSDGSDFKVAQGSLHSLLIGSLGKLVGLSSQLKILCGNLFDKTKESGKPVTGSADLSKINSLMSDVKRAFGYYSDDGLNNGIEQMLRDLSVMGGRGVPQVTQLLDLYGANMTDAEAIIGRLQRNEYDTSLESVFIQGRSQAPGRAEGRAAGTERQVWTKDEYALMLQLRDEGLLAGDDFTSVFEGYADDESSIASSRSSRSSRSSSSRSSRSSESSGRVFRPARYSRRGYEKEGDSPSSSSGEDDSGLYPGDVMPRTPGRPRWMREEPDSDDDTLSTGSGLYSIPPSKRFPQRIF